MLKNRIKQTLSTIVGVSCMVAMSQASLAEQATGMSMVKSSHDMEQTVAKLQTVIESKGMTVVSHRDHAKAAAGVGIELRPTQYVEFANPAIGSKIMQCAQTAAIDLPQKMLVWQDEQDAVWLGYNEPQYLMTRHGGEGCEEIVKKVSGALGAIAKEASQ